MKHARIPVGILCLFIVLLLNLLAASPSLHERFHPDANHAGHECAVTMFAHGHVAAPVADLPVVIPVAVVASLPQPVVSIVNPLVATLPPGRAPPSLCFAS